MDIPDRKNIDDDSDGSIEIDIDEVVEAAADDEVAAPRLSFAPAVPVEFDRLRVSSSTSRPTSTDDLQQPIPIPRGPSKET
jgi:hypothetical protein